MTRGTLMITVAYKAISVCEQLSLLGLIAEKSDSAFFHPLTITLMEANLAIAKEVHGILGAAYEVRDEPETIIMLNAIRGIIKVSIDRFEEDLKKEKEKA